MMNSSAVVVFLDRFLPLFYLKSPNQSSVQHVHQVPNYVQQVVPQFFILIFLEMVVRVLQNKRLPRINDSISSISAGMIMEMSKNLLLGTIGVTTYIWVYERCCLFSLPWDSPLTWWIAFFAVDCGYYWFHRMAHEVNLFWAAHQVHHSSEDYTLSTALRQSALQRFTSWFFYFPLALAIPPSIYLLHKQFNLLYQFWIHTEVIDRLGPLEWVLNTPSHHRVHHGRNPYCIDKNYAGVLIIWDRMFGTFQPESPDEKVIYGLVHPLSTWNPIWAQLHHLIYIATTISSHKGIWNKLCFLFKGPGWAPGKPRLGLNKDIPHVSPNSKPYHRSVPGWLNLYCVVHFFLILYWSQELSLSKASISYLTLLAVSLYLIVSLTSFGLMFDHNPLSAKLELGRLLVLLFVHLYLASQDISLRSITMATFVLNVASLVLWTGIVFRK